MPRRTPAEILKEKKDLADGLLSDLKDDADIESTESTGATTAAKLYEQAKVLAGTKKGIEILAATKEQRNCFSRRLVGPLSLLFKRKTVKTSLVSADLDFIVRATSCRGVHPLIVEAALAHPASTVDTVHTAIATGNSWSVEKAMQDPRCTPDAIEKAVENGSRTLANSEKLSSEAIVRLMRKPIPVDCKREMLMANPNMPQEVKNKVWAAAARGKGIVGIFSKEEAAPFAATIQPDVETASAFIDESTPEEVLKKARGLAFPINRNEEDGVETVPGEVMSRLWGKLKEKPVDFIKLIVQKGYTFRRSIPKEAGESLLRSRYSSTSTDDDYLSGYDARNITSNILSEYNDPGFGRGKLPDDIYDAIAKKALSPDHSLANSERVALTSDSAPADKLNDLAKLVFAQEHPDDAQLIQRLSDHNALSDENLKSLMEGGNKGYGLRGEIKPDSKKFPYAMKALSSPDEETRGHAMACLKIPKQDLLSHLDSAYPDVKEWAKDQVLEVNTAKDAQDLSDMLDSKPELAGKFAGEKMFGIMSSTQWRDDPDRFRQLADSIARARADGRPAPPFEYPISDAEKKKRAGFQAKVLDAIIANKDFNALSNALTSVSLSVADKSRMLDAFLPLGGTKANKFKDIFTEKKKDNDYYYTTPATRYAQTIEKVLRDSPSAVTDAHIGWILDNATNENVEELVNSLPKRIPAARADEHWNGIFKNIKDPYDVQRRVTIATENGADYTRFLSLKVGDLAGSAFNGMSESFKKDALSDIKTSVTHALRWKIGLPEAEALLSPEAQAKYELSSDAIYHLKARIGELKEDAERNNKKKKTADGGDSIDSAYTERSHFLVDSSKLRKLRDAIMAVSPANHNLHAKEVAKIPGMGGDFSKFRDKHGLVNADVIQEYLDKTPPTVEYNIDHSTWGHDGWDLDVESKRGWDGYLGQQKHNDEQSKVFRINLTDKLKSQLIDAGVWEDFKGVMAHVRQHHGCHPVDFNNTLGWVRWTGDPEKNAIFIDEVQTDPFSDMHNMMADGALSDEKRKTISNILYGGKHANLATMEAFHQHWRSKGKVGMKIAIHDTSSKQTISLGRHTSVRWPDTMTFDASGKLTAVKPGKQLSPPPVHMVTTYSEIPPKNMGMEPSEYRKENMETQNNPWFQGRKTWQHLLRKDIAPMSMGAYSYLSISDQVRGFKSALIPGSYNNIATPEVQSALEALGGVDANPNLVALIQLCRREGLYMEPVEKAMSTVPFDRKQLALFSAMAKARGKASFNPAPLLRNPSVAADPEALRSMTETFISGWGTDAIDYMARHKLLTPEIVEWTAVNKEQVIRDAVTYGGMPSEFAPALIESPNVGFDIKLRMAKVSKDPALRSAMFKKALGIVIKADADRTDKSADDYRASIEAVQSLYEWNITLDEEDAKAITGNATLVRAFSSNWRNMDSSSITVTPELADAVVLSRRGDDYDITGRNFLSKVTPATREKILTDPDQYAWSNVAPQLANVLAEGPITDEVHRIARSGRRLVRAKLWAMPGWHPEELHDAADLAAKDGDGQLAISLMSHPNATQELADKMMSSPILKPHLLARGKSPFLFKYFKDALRSDDANERMTAINRMSAFSKEDLEKELLENPHDDVLVGAVNSLSNVGKYITDPSIVENLLSRHNERLTENLMGHFVNAMRSDQIKDKPAMSKLAAAVASQRVDDAIRNDSDTTPSYQINDILKHGGVAADFDPALTKMFGSKRSAAQKSYAFNDLAAVLPEHIVSGLAANNDANYALEKSPHAPSDFVDKLGLDPMIDTYRRQIAITHPNFTKHADLLRDIHPTIRATAVAGGAIPADILEAHLPNEKDLGVQRTIKGALRQLRPDAEHKRRVKVSMGNMKVRKLRDILEAKPTKDIHAKEIAKIPGMGGNWDKFKDAKGRVSAARLQQHLDTAPPDFDFNVGYARFGIRMGSNNEWDAPGTTKPDGTPDWDGIIRTQRHNNRHSNVLQVNITDDMVKRVKEAGLYPVFDKVLRARHSTWHPLRRGEINPDGESWEWNHTLGWCRWTGSPETGIFIDELQSDFGQDLNKMVKAGKLHKDHAKKLHEIVYGGHHPNAVMGEVFLQWLRDKGHGNTKVAIHGLDSKARISLPEKPTAATPPPVHMKITYNDTPPTWGMEPGEYSEKEMPTMNNPHFQGRKTWTGLVRKYEEGQPMTKAELSELEAILSICEI